MGCRLPALPPVPGFRGVDSDPVGLWRAGESLDWKSEDRLLARSWFSRVFSFGALERKVDLKACQVGRVSRAVPRGARMAWAGSVFTIEGR